MVARRSLASQRALVIEDDPAANKLIQASLVDLGLTVHAVTNGEAALHFMEDHQVELVCLDLMLPDRSGFQICEIIRRSSAHATVPVLVITARNETEARVYAEEAGANGYLVKPFKRADLKANVFRLLGLDARRRRGVDGG